MNNLAQLIEEQAEIIRRQADINSRLSLALLQHITHEELERITDEEIIYQPTDERQNR